MLDDLLREILSSRVYDVAKETPLEAAAKLSSRLENLVFLKQNCSFCAKPLFFWKSYLYFVFFIEVRRF